MPISAKMVTRLSRGARGCSFRGCSGDALPLHQGLGRAWPVAVDGSAAVDFGFAREVLQCGIAALYLVAFVSTLTLSARIGPS